MGGDRVSSVTIANCWQHTKISGPEPEEAISSFSVPTVSNVVNEDVALLQDSLNTAGARTTPLAPIRADEYMAFDANVPTEQEWSDQDIIEQVQEELRQAAADIQGKILYDEDEDKAESDCPESGTTNKSSTSIIDSPAAALASIDAL